MDLERFETWLDAYFAAWVSNDPGEVGALFAEEAVYSWGPFREPARGRAAIVSAWVDGPSQVNVRWRHEALAVAATSGIAHWQVSFDDPDGGRTELDGILAIDFDASGQCVRHREWYDRRSVLA